MGKLRTFRARPYRNDVVLQSAERLIAVAAKNDLQCRRHSARPRRWAGWLVFGLLVGAAGFKLGETWSKFNAIPVESRPSTWRARLIWLADPSPAAGEHFSPEAVPRELAAVGSTVLQPPNLTDTAAGAPILRSSASAIMRAGPSFIGIQIPDTSIPLGGSEGKTDEILLLVAGEILLRGELRTEGFPPMKVEFVLHRNRSSAGVEGLVRFLDDGMMRVAAISVQGTTADGAIVLRETSLVWTRSNAPALTVGREYKIVLPAEATPSEFTGTWTLGDITGTLHLAPGLPW